MKRGRIVNILLIIAIALILFTPVGFHIKVLVNRLISFDPTPVEERQRQVLDSFDWQLTDRQGRVYNLSEAKGKVIFINIWASWCPPCVAEMPDLRDLYSDYHQDVVFLFIARDRKVKVDEFMTKKNYGFPVYYEAGQTPEQLYSTVIPTTYILNKYGVIVVAETGTASWNSSTTRNLIDKLLSE